MIYSLKQFPDKKFSDKMDLSRFIKENLQAIKKIKCSEYKTDADVVLKSGIYTNKFEPLIENITSDIIEVKAIINTTNVIDSHMDLHVKGIWNKTVSDNPYTYHIKQHENRFESILSSRAKNINETMNFKDIGLSIDKEMEANINLFTLDKAKNEFMFNQYVNGEVKQHSVGMRYINIDLAWYDEESQKEMDFFNWAKSEAINPEIADEYGYVFVVREAAKREGSAVVFGSNPFTPTLYVKNYEPSKDTRKQEPPEGTQTEQKKKSITFI